MLFKRRAGGVPVKKPPEQGAIPTRREAWLYSAARMAESATIRKSREMTMTQVCIARFSELQGNRTGFLDTALSGGAKENLKLIGRGSPENPFQPAIPGDHRYLMNWVKIPPGGGSRLHSHPTHEVFIPIEGAMTIYWLAEDGQQRSLTAEARDCVSVQGGVMRGFRNDGPGSALMLTVVTGHDAGGPLVWHADVVAERDALNT